MGIQLKQNEEIICRVDFHWMTYIIPALGFFFFSILGAPACWFGDNRPMDLVAFCAGLFPLLYRYLDNLCKEYVVTNRRVYLEEGILAKRKKDIPLQKVNDVEVIQSLFQRIFSAGNLLLLTGNDKPHVIKCVDDPDAFREAILEATQSAASAPPPIPVRRSS